MPRLQLQISGHVQGVFYRTHTCDKARRLGLTGWVRNCADGSVAVCAEGERAALEKLLTACYRGPTNARVDRIEPTWSVETGEFRDFRIAG
ncbi:MAG: acylphosphatase [Deltaproteobacteria bacterium]|nr:acylphosphatase [Deltaproteobacteria bacterium]